VSGKEFRLRIKGRLNNVKLLLWSVFILADNLVRVLLHAEESIGTAHHWNPRLLWNSLFSDLLYDDNSADNWVV